MARLMRHESVALWPLTTQALLTRTRTILTMITQASSSSCASSATSLPPPAKTAAHRRSR